MGMDLVALAPRDPGNETFRANLTGWGVLADLLTELGCDLSELSTTNDGDVVREVTAREWGTAILENLDRIVEVRYADPMFYEGYRSEFKVAGTTTPVLLSRHELTRTIVSAAMGNEPAEFPAGDEVPLVVPVLELDKSRQWLERVASFFLNSGGFAQF